jgi:hypothetical protein
MTNGERQNDKEKQHRDHCTVILRERSDRRIYSLRLTETLLMSFSISMGLVMKSLAPRE